MEPFIAAYVATAPIMALLGRWIAVQKGRRPIEGATLGLLFHALGVIVEGQLPSPPRLADEFPTARRYEEPVRTDLPPRSDRPIKVVPYLWDKREESDDA